MNSETRIQELEAQVAELSAAQEEKRSSRRGMLKLAGAAAAGAVVATASNAMPAAALDGDPVNVAEHTSTSAASREATAVVYANTATPQVPTVFGDANSNIFLVRDDPAPILFGNRSSSSYPAALAGYSYETVANGVYGFTAMTGHGVVGWGSGSTAIGVLARGESANLELLAAGNSGPSRGGTHRLGEVICDSAGDLWVCVVAGTPGTWRKVTGAGVAGAFHALSPGRVYDSRITGSPLAGGMNRLVSVADKINDAGVVTVANFVPAGATAVTANVTVANTAGAGFLTANPGGNTAVESSTINWSGAGQLLANGVTLTLNGSRQLTVIAGGGGSADFIIDISGYYL